MDALYTNVGVSNIGLDGRKRVIGNSDVEQRGRVEESRFPDVWFANDTGDQLSGLSNEVQANN